MLTLRAAVFAILLAGLLGWLIQALDVVWTWPLAGLIVLAAWFAFGQKIDLADPK